MAGHIVEQKESLSPALTKSFKNVDGPIDLSEKIVSVKVSIAILASLEDNPGFSGECNDM